MKRILASAALAVIFFARPFPAQVLMSAGTNYAQNFDALATSSSSNGWTNNVTLPGWYAATNSSSVKSGAVAVYNAGTGSSTSGGLYSFGDAGSPDRALGSLASSGPGNLAYGVRFINDTAMTATNFIVSYAGEEWRVQNASAQKLAFAYQIGIALTSADAQNAQVWLAFPALDFSAPNTNLNSSSRALAGNDPTNRVVFTNIVLTGVAVPPGQEIFLRWYDADDAGFDDGLAVDDLSVGFQFTTPPVSAVAASNSNVTLMTYNVKGNGVADWSTNAAQVQAIGREIIYLGPDIITFNEIPYTNVWQMTNWVVAFMPGFNLATNSGTDGYIRSVIASRFPIVRSQKWLDGADLNPFGYTNANFTRDLFEAEINVPNWALPLHVFTTHLKSTGTNYADSAAKRAAEAAAIINFFATNFFVLHPTHPFTLSGDMNESDTNALAIQRLISAPTTLGLTNPTNRVSGSINTFSIQASLSERIDYIFPCALLCSNVTASQVFRTDLMTPLPPSLNGNDDSTASDHLPVLMTFANPFNTPFRLLSFSRTNQVITLRWESATNRLFNVETSTNLQNWTPVATNLFTTTTNFTFTTNSAEVKKFFRIYRVP